VIPRLNLAGAGVGAGTGGVVPKLNLADAGVGAGAGGPQPAAATAPLEFDKFGNAVAQPAAREGRAKRRSVTFGAGVGDHGGLSAGPERLTTALLQRLSTPTGHVEDPEGKMVGRRKRERVSTRACSASASASASASGARRSLVRVAARCRVCAVVAVVRAHSLLVGARARLLRFSCRCALPMVLFVVYGAVRPIWRCESNMALFVVYGAMSSDL
jgi:hypothetical protein